MKKEEYIKDLLDKYVSGDTTAGEENALRGYFANPDNRIPDEWLPFKALFAYVDEEQEAAGTAVKAVEMKPRGKSVKRFKTLVITAAAAAAIAVVVITHGVSRPENYAVIDGKVYTDKQTVNEEALEALHMVSSDYSDSFDALDMMRPDDK